MSDHNEPPFDCRALGDNDLIRAPLSPIALNFNIPEKRYGIEFMDANDYDPNKKTAPGMQPVWLAAYDQAILAQHLAIVARVAQEEREKAFKEVRARIVDDGNPALIREWIDVQLRGTP